VSVVLPSELAWVLNLLGFNWPNIDEDKLRAAAASDRRLAARAVLAHTHVGNAAHVITTRNAGKSIDAFSSHSGKVSVHLGRLREVYGLSADALDIMADIVEGAKIAVVAQLAALATELAAAAAGTILTLGISDAAGAAATAVTRITVQQLLDELERGVISAAEGIVISGAVAALSASTAALGGQLVSDYVGTGHGVSAAAAADAGTAAAAGTARALSDPEMAGTSVATGAAVGLTGGGAE
jgi:hypothetical protein